jgi:hypothetical protein
MIHARDAIVRDWTRPACHSAGRQGPWDDSINSFIWVQSPPASSVPGLSPTQRQHRVKGRMGSRFEE